MMTFLQKSDRRTARMYGKAAIELAQNGNVEGSREMATLAAHYALRSMEWH
jgi:hypothetical protein